MAVDDTVLAVGVVDNNIFTCPLLLVLWLLPVAPLTVAVDVELLTVVGIILADWIEQRCAASKQIPKTSALPLFTYTSALSLYLFLSPVFFTFVQITANN